MENSIKVSKNDAPIIQISPSKNSSIAILIASLVTKTNIVFRNVSKTIDAEFAIKLLKECGCDVSVGENVSIKTRITKCDIKSSSNLRSSLSLLGAYFAHNKELRINYPGGCRFSHRPFDIHIDCLSRLGANIAIDGEYIILHKSNRRKENITIELPIPSVGVTANLILSSVLNKGWLTIIKNAAKEPEIQDMCNFLAKCGVQIHGIGTDAIAIYGTDDFISNCEYQIYNDRIEAQTMMIASVLSEKDAIISGVKIDHVRALINLLYEIGVPIEIQNNKIYMRSSSIKELKPFEAKTSYYPELPTDIQPMLVVLGLKIGNCVIEEGVYRERFTHIDELQKMGAIIIRDGNIIKTHKSFLTGADVDAKDIRCGAALLLASLLASGVTKINQVDQIMRGYENFKEKMNIFGLQFNFMDYTN